MKNIYILDSGVKFTFSIDPAQNRVTLLMRRPELPFNVGNTSYGFGQEAPVSQITAMVNRLNLDAEERMDVIEELTHIGNNLLHRGTIQEVAAGFDFRDEKIIFMRFNATGNIHAFMQRDEENVVAFSFSPQKYSMPSGALGLDVDAARKLIEALDISHQDIKKIDQMAALRTAAFNFAKRIELLLGEEDRELKEEKKSLSQQLVGMTFDFAHSQAEVYTGEITQSLWLFDEQHVIKVKVTTVKVNDEWKKLHYTLPDRVVKIECNAGLSETVSEILTRMVDNDELELLI